MKPTPPDSSDLYVLESPDLRLSGLSLLALMQAVLDRGLPFRFSARGWSMAPFIQDGDVLTVSRSPRARWRLGEVVAFVRPQSGALVVHRVIARRGSDLVIRGDQVPPDEARSVTSPVGLDDIVPIENLLGRVIRVERRGRSVHWGLGPERYLIAALSRRGWPAVYLLRTARRLGKALSVRRTVS